MKAQLKLKDALTSNLGWFENSGVMVPKDGLWGVAERVALKGNDSMDKIYSHFQAWTEFGGYSVIEHRRADCNFETALLFLLASEALNRKKFRCVAENILDFLYFRSGMLTRFSSDEALVGTWAWSHVGRGIWFDDNAWNCAIQLAIGAKYPGLERKYGMMKWGIALADKIAAAFMSHFEAAEGFKPVWLGNLKLPHWGSLACMAMAKAYGISEKPIYKKVVDRYRKFLLQNKDSLNASETAYAAIGAGICHSVFNADESKRLALLFGDRLASKMDTQTGNIPAEHFEAPPGPHLADTIYTMNWALMALQILAGVTGDEKYRLAFLKILDLLLKIQDRSPEKHLKGCWRGMFDIKAGKWGGGDRFEGGANSIYTGWTNAPISICIALEMQGKSLADL